VEGETLGYYRCSLFPAPGPVAAVARSSRAHPANGPSAWASMYFRNPLHLCRAAPLERRSSQGRPGPLQPCGYDLVAAHAWPALGIAVLTTLAVARQDWPESLHWDWGRKSLGLAFTAPDDFRLMALCRQSIWEAAVVTLCKDHVALLALRALTAPKSAFSSGTQCQSQPFRAG